MQNLIPTMKTAKVSATVFNHNFCENSPGSIQRSFRRWCLCLAFILSTVISHAQIRDINIKGNGLDIALGDNSPSYYDSTDFELAVWNNNRSVTYTIENTGAQDLYVFSINISGLGSSYFSTPALGSPLIIPGASSTTFVVTFNPAMTSDVKTATISVNSDDPDENNYSFDIKGQGTNQYYFYGSGNWNETWRWLRGYPGNTIPSGYAFYGNASETLTIPTGMNITNGGTFFHDGNLNVASGATLDNTGNLRFISMVNNGGITNQSSGYFLVDYGVLDNYGSLTNQGDLVAQYGGVNNYATIDNYGLFSTYGGAFISNDVSGTIHNYGSGTLNNASTFTNSGTYINQGIYKGSGSFSGSVFNNTGSVSPGASPGCQTFLSGFTTTGTLNMEIQGVVDNCSEFDKINVTGTATLGGTLALSISYTPTSNTTLTIIDASALSGTFSNITGLASNWSINYNTGNGNVELIYTVPTTTLMNITSSGQSATSCKYTNTSGSAMTIRITATGGGGGNGYESFSSTVAPGSTGATMKGEFTLAPGETILAVAGAQGQNGQTNGDNGGGGGAGSGVVNLSSNSLLILAAGGGGAYWDGTGIAGSATTGGSGDGGEGLFSMGGGGFNGDGTIMFPANGCPTGGGQVSLTGISAGGLKCTAYSGGNGGSGMGGGGGASDQGGGGGGYTGGSGDYLPGGSALSYNTGANQVNTDGSNNAGPNAGSILIECVGSGCPTPAFTPASQPTLSATATTICTSQSTTLSILSGAPNDATDWYWYSGSCGGTAIGSGTSIVVSPSTTTTYYARGEGTCVSPGTCANITINFQTAEIDVTGNSNPIADGSNTPLLSNHTDFNTVAAGSTQVRTFTIENTGTSNLTISSIDLSGTNAGLFTVGALSPASPIPAGSTATFTVSFLPTTTGLKTATVTINNDDCNEGAYDFAIQGTGIQATTTLSLSGPSSSTLGSANTFTATLTRVSPPAGPMAGQTVTFTIVLPNSSTSNYNATTNASGEASISYSSIMTGVHAISADFLGNATHAASTSNILSHTVCTLPAITCPGNQNANTSSSTCDAIVTYAPSSVTGSPAPTITYSFSGATTGSGSGDGSGSTFNKGTTTVTLTATNTCGSASCSFDVVVSDNVPPVITCAADVNINNTPGLCSGTTTLTPPTVTDNCSSTLGNALDFDGTGTLNHATLPPGVYFNGDFTIECWVYPKAFTNWSRIIDFGNGAGYNNILLAYTYGTSGNPGLYIEGVQIASTATLPLNQWSHVAATFSATNSIGTIYVNGVAAGTGYFNTPVNVVRNYNYVGRSNWGPGTDPDANAIYDELRIWNVERTQAEIQSTMTSELTGTETGLQIYYPFNQGITCGNNTSITDILDMAPAGGTTNATLQNFTLNGGCTSNFTNGSVSTFGLTNNAPSSYPLGNTTVTWTATDASGNTATCEQIVTVNDTEAPSITCPANISVNNTSGLCGAVVTYTAPTGTDNCPGASTTQIAGLASGATFPVGTTTNTFRVTDAAGNSATCSFTVTVIDNQVPVVTCPPAITVSVNSSCGASLYGVNPAYVVNRTQCFNPGQAAATIVAPTPGNMTGWVQTFNQYVLVSNAIAGGSYVASASGNNFLTVTQGAPNGPVVAIGWGTIIAGGGARWTAAVSGDYYVHMHRYDIPCGGTFGQSIYLTALAPGQVNLGSVIISENCTVASVTNDAPTNFSLGTTIVTWTVTDAAGNSTTCQQSVTVIDDEAPSITCNGPVTISNNPGLCTGTTTLTAPTASDNCNTFDNALNFDGNNDFINIGNVSQLNGVNKFTFETWVYPTSNGTQIISCKGPATSVNAIDIERGGTGTLYFRICGGSDSYGKIDNALPLNQWKHIACVYDGTLTGNANRCKIFVNGVQQTLTFIGANIPAVTPSTSTPLCIGAYNGGIFPFSGILDEFRIWNVARTQAEIQANMYSEVSSQPELISLYHFNQGVAGGNNSGVTTANDASGSYNGTLTNFALNGFTSNWVLHSPIISNNAPTTYPLGNTTVTWTATDASGNTATCEQIVTVNDTEAPSITCPANISINTTAGQCSAVVTYTAPVGTDNCPGATTVQTAGLASGSSFPIGTTTNTFRVTDAAGNTMTCSFTVTVSDNQAPVITCPPAITVSVNSSCGASLYGVNPAFVVNRTQCFNPGQAAASIVAPTPGNMTGWNQTFNQYVLVSNAIAGVSYVASASGNNFLTVTQGAPNGPVVAIGWGTIIAGGGARWTAAVSGDYYVHMHRYDIPCGGTFGQSIYLTALAPGQVNLGSVIISENCTVASVTNDAPTNFSLGTTIVTWTVTDASGNSVTCQQSVTVIDDEVPTIACPANISVNNDPGQCSAVVSYTTPVGTDNCSGAITTQITGLASGATFPIGTTTNTFRVTDAAGNSATCSFDVIVTDSEAPSITCPANISVNNTPGQCGAAVTYTAPTGTDNCPGASTTQIAGLASGATFPIGTTTNTFRVTDAAGNSATCSFDVIVTDAEAPSITCTANISVNNTPGQCGAAVVYTAPTGTDNCPGASTTQIAGLVSGATFPVGTTTNTFRVTDAAGNTMTCSFTVTVSDTELPVFNASGLGAPPSLATSNVAEASQYGVVYALDIPVSSDYNNTAIPYSINNSALTGIDFSRVAYFMQLDSKWVWVSMDKFNSGLTLPQLAIPNATYNNVAFQQVVNNMNVFGSSGSGVTNGTGLSGNVELWHNCYNQTAGLTSPAIGGNSSLYDFNDTRSVSNPSCYGSFQVHNYNAAQTIFGYNAWDTPSGGNDDLGIGNQVGGSGHPDWTYAYNAGSYTTRKLYIMVNATGCPPNMAVNNDPGQCGAVVNYTAPVGTDNCPGASTVQTAGLASGATFPIGTTTNTFRVTDAAGNSATCSFTVTVSDNQGPTITCPANATAYVNANCEYVVGDYTTASNVTLTATVNSGTSGTSCTDGFLGGAPEPQWQVSFAGQPAVIYPQNGICYTNPPYLQYSQQYPCSTLYPGTIQVCFSAFEDDGAACIPAQSCLEQICQNYPTPAPGTSATYTLSIPSGGGNTSWGSVTFTLDASGSFGVCPVSVSDNCPGAITLSQSPLPGTVLGAGNHVITVYATDISNNVSSCTHTVTVLDTIKPTLTCPANISVPSSFGQCAAIVMFINPIGTDNCPGAITTQIAGLPSGSAFPVGTTTNTFRVTDASGNSSTCSFTVTVNDVEAPLITCGANVTANNTTNLCSGVVTVASPTITDNCSTGATPVAGNALYFDGADDYISTVLDVSETSYTAEMWFRTTKANCGIFSVTQGVFGGNNDRHIILTGGNIRVRVWNNEVITTSGTNYADGNWHHVAHVFGTGVPNRIYVDGILKATGSFQASAFNWQDRINLGYSADAGGSFFQGELENVRVWDVAKSQAEIIQGMNADPIGCTPQVWYKFNQGTAGGNNTAITQADDNSGNNHPGPLTNFARTGSTSNFVTGLSFTPSPITITNSFNNSCNASGTYPVGVTTVLWTVTDAAGNTATCTQTVTVNDTQLPTLNCPANISTNNTSGLCSKVVTYTTPIGTDNCPGAVTIQTAGLASGSTFPVGTTTNTFRVTDAAGNTMTCSFTVTVNDTQAPTVSCPTNVSVNVDAGQCSAVVITTNSTPNDNCGVTKLTWALSGATSGTSPTTGINYVGTATFNKGITTVTYTATDAAGNTGTCSYTVTVIDNIPPSITCPANVSVFNDFGVCQASGVALGLPTYSDNCGSAGSNGLHFDGNNDNVTTTYAPMTTATATLEAWVKPELRSEAASIASYPNNVISTDNPGSYGRGFGVTVLSGAAGISLEYVSGFRYINYPFVPNTWYHVAVVYTSTNIKTYVNGVLVDDFNVSNGTSPYPLKIGKHNDDTGYGTRRFFKGTMDEIRIWNIARTQSQIQSDKDIELSVQPGLLASYHFNQGAAGSNNAGVNTLIDAASTPHNGTLNSFALNGATSNWVTGKLGNIAVTNNAPSVYPVGNTNVVWTATDGSGNSTTCTQVVTVVDNENPAFIGNTPTPITLVNPDFEILYKPGSTSITASPMPLYGGTFGLSNLGMSGTSVTFSDASVGSTFDLPGWTFNTATVQGITNENGNFVSPRNQIAWFNGASFGGGTGEHTMSQVVPENLQQGYEYTVTADFGWRMDNTIATMPPVLRLYAGATLLTPTVSISPALVNGDFVTYTRKYLVNNNSISGPLRVEFGLGANTNGQQLNADHITLTKKAPLNNLTVNNDLHSCGAVVSWPTPTTSDNCAVQGVTSTPASGSYFPVGTTTVTSTVTDIHGNSSTATFDVTVVDNEAPVITCPPAFSASANAAICVYAGSIGTATATDNCSATVSGPVPAGPYPVGTTTVVWTATDAAGNTHTCTQTVTIIAPDLDVSGNSIPIPNNNIPVSLADLTDFGDITVGQTATSTFEILNAGTDNLVIPAGAITFSGTDAALFNVGSISLPATIPPAGTLSVPVLFSPSSLGLKSATIHIASDDCDEPDYQFNLQGNGFCLPADIVCPANMTVNTDNGNCSAVVTYTPTLIGFPAPDVTYTFSGMTTGSGTGTGSGATFGVGTTTVTISVNNICGAQTCSFDILVEDHELPTITCPPAFTAVANSPLCTYTGSIGTPTASDNCTYSVSGPVPAAPYPVGTTTVVWTVTDASGNTASCTQDVTVINPVPVPVVVASGPTNLCSGQTVTLSTTQPFGGYTWTGNVNLPTLYVAASGLYSVVVSNANGCTQSSLPMSVTINPVATEFTSCPTDIIVSQDPGQCGAVVNFNAPNYTLCNACNFVPNISGYSYLGTYGGHYYYISDGAGTWSAARNQAISKGGHLVTISSSAENAFVQTATNTAGSIFIGITDEAVEGNFGWLNGETVSYTNWGSGTPNNSGGNEDYGQMNTSGLWNDVNGSTILRHVMEISCGQMVQSSGLPSGSQYPVGTTHNVFTVFSGNGQFATCSFDVTVNDNTIPQIQCVSDITVNADPDVCGTYKNYSGVCSDYSVHPIPFAPIPGTGTVLAMGDNQMSGTLPINFNFNYFCTNYSQFYISSNGFITFSPGQTSGCCSGQYMPDPFSPNNIIAAVWDDLNPALGGSINYFTTGTAPHRKLVVNYQNVPLANSIPFGLPSVNAQIILYETSNVIEVHTAYANNLSIASMGIENATGTKGYTVPGRNYANWSALNDAWRFSPGVAAVTVTATDNCAVVVTNDAPALLPVGTTAVHYTATDASGNTAQCTQNITVLDTQLPVISCPPAATLVANFNGCTYSGSVGTPLVSDNCAVSISGPVPAGPYPVGTTMVVWTATDASGNTATCTQQIDVLPGNTTGVSTITACDSYQWNCNNNTYTQGGTYTCTYLNTIGCQHTQTLNLTVNHSTSGSESATACDSYQWMCNGATYTQSGTYTCTYMNTNNCVHTQTLYLTVNYSTSGSTAITACDSYQWNCNNATYTQSGTYTCTYLNTNNCVHTQTLNLTMNYSTSGSESATACDSYQWMCNGVTYTQSGTYTCTYMNTNNCVHTQTLNLTVNYSTSGSESATACDSYQWMCNGATYTQSGTYTCTYMNTNNCVHTQTLNLTVNYSTSGSTAITACDSYQWNCNNATYTQGGTYTCTYLNTNNCVHTQTLNLTVNYSTSGSESATACDTYQWMCNGATYTQSGTYTCTYMNTSNCVHTQTLYLTVNYNTSGSETATACDSYQWMCNGATYTQSGTYTCTYMNTNNCVHTQTLYLTVNYSTSGSTAITACDSYQWNCNNATYTQSGTYTCTYLNANNCVHTQTLNLTVNYSTSGSESATACDSYQWMCNGATYTQGGTYTCTYLNTNNCVHTQTLNLTVNYSTSGSESATACDSYQWMCNGATYTQSGTYTCTYINTNNCVHTQTLNLTVNYSTSGSTAITACDSYQWNCNNATYTQGGTYTCTYLNTNNCVHTQTLNLTVNYSTSGSESATACDTYQWMCNGATYTQSGTYTCTYMNTSNCVHTQTLNLTVNYSTSGSTAITACDAYTWTCNNFNLTQSGTYTCTYLNTNNCVHTQTLYLTVNQSTAHSSSFTADGCYTWAENGITYTQSGTYTHTTLNTSGCTHTETLVLTVIPKVTLAAKAILSGAYDSGNGLMTDSLRVQGIIPTMEPYSFAPFLKPAIVCTNHETTSPTVLLVTGNNAIVDWVLFELRSASNPAVIVATKRALIQRDGDIVSAHDGISPVVFDNVPGGNYFISIKHRNHLGVMTAQALTMSQCSVTSYNFTSDPVYVNPSITNAPRKSIGSLYGLWNSDANTNKNVKYNGGSNDKDQVLLAVGGTPYINSTVYGYRPEDLNMDGKVRFNGTDNDRNVILSTVGVSTPNNILSQHTPN